MHAKIVEFEETETLGEEHKEADVDADTKTTKLQRRVPQQLLLEDEENVAKSDTAKMHITTLPLDELGRTCKH